MGVWELMHEASAELVRRAWAAYDRGDEAAFAACLTDDWREYGPDGGSATLEDERPTMELHRSAFPNKHTEFHRIVTDEDEVSVARDLIPVKYAHREEGLEEWAQTALPVAIDINSQ